MTGMVAHIAHDSSSSRWFRIGEGLEVGDCWEHGGLNRYFPVSGAANARLAKTDDF